MTNLRRTSVYTFIIIALLAVSIGFVQAMTTSFTVKGGEEITHPISLAYEDRVLIQFSAVGVGEASSTLHFWIVFPNETVRDFGEVGKASYSFICDVEGEYTLHFVNNDAAVDKLVTLNYEIDHYVFGIPQMLFMTIIVVLACVGGVAAYVLMGRTYR